MKIKVLLAEDHQIVREGLRLLLEAAADIEVVGEAADGRDAVEFCRRLAPEIVIMDLVMPVLSGLEAARQIGRAMPRSKIVVLSSYYDEEGVRQMVALGVRGYLSKQTAATELLEAIRAVRRGDLYFSAVISRSICGQARQAGNAIHRGDFVLKSPARLTLRENQVLKLIAEGFPNKNVAVQLGISIKTVEKHRQHVMNKLHLHDTAALTRHALATGLIERQASPEPSLA